MTTKSASDSLTEAFAAWNSISSSAQSTLRPDDPREHERVQAPTLRLPALGPIQRQTITPRKVAYLTRIFGGHQKAVTSVAFSPDGTTIVSSSFDESIRVWDLISGRQLHQLDNPGEVNSVRVSPDGTTILALFFRGRIRAWEASTEKRLPQLGRHKAHVQQVGFSPDASIIITDEDPWTSIGEVATGRHLLHLENDHSYIARRITISPDNATLAVVAHDNSASLLEVATGRHLRQLDESIARCSELVFSPDGATLATAFADGTIILWETTTGKKPQQLHGHRGAVYHVAFSPDGTTIASCSRDRSIRVWDVATGRQLRQLDGHRDGVFIVAFSPDGTAIASGSQDRTVRLWADVLRK